MTGHGIDNEGIALWDFNGDGKLDRNEYYTPEQFEWDTRNCQVERLFVVMDQCYSGEFTYIANQPTHRNTAIYTAASGSEESWGNDLFGGNYMSGWKDFNSNDWFTTMNERHAAASEVIASQPPKESSTPQVAGRNNGDDPVCGEGIGCCCPDETGDACGANCCCCGGGFAPRGPLCECVPV